MLCKLLYCSLLLLYGGQVGGLQTVLTARLLGMCLLCACPAGNGAPSVRQRPRRTRGYGERETENAKNSSG
jgi:hypothetical protein